MARKQVSFLLLIILSFTVSSFGMFEGPVKTYSKCSYQKPEYSVGAKLINTRCLQNNKQITAIYLILGEEIIGIESTSKRKIKLTKKDNKGNLLYFNSPFIRMDVYGKFYYKIDDIESALARIIKQVDLITQ